jgi:hypothetical protein
LERGADGVTGGVVVGRFRERDEKARVRKKASVRRVELRGVVGVRRALERYGRRPAMGAVALLAARAGDVRRG